MKESRYSRQMLFPPIGEAGQARLLGSRVVIVGCGATGSMASNLLARAGIGHLRIVDRDVVEWTNLQRQVLFEESDAREGIPKAVAAAQRLRAINSEIEIEGVTEDLRAANAGVLLEGADLVIDGTDNFETRYLINDLCVRDGRSWVYSGIVSTYGMCLPVQPGVTACFQCLFPEPPPPGAAATCDVAGVLGPAVGTVASLAVMEGIKLLVGATSAVAAGAIQVDLWDNVYALLPVRRRTAGEGCACCVQRHFRFLEASASTQATALCGRDAVQVTPPRPLPYSLEELARRLKGVVDVRHNAYVLRARIGDCELTLFPGGRAIIHGTDDEAAARALYARYVGI